MALEHAKCIGAVVKVGGRKGRTTQWGYSLKLLQDEALKAPCARVRLNKGSPRTSTAEVLAPMRKKSIT